MTARYLLDVSVLMALLWDLHDHNSRATKWQESAGALAICPITELGFLRISTQPVFGATVEEARQMLKDWKDARQPEFIPCDIDALNSSAPDVGAKTTDFYLAALAESRGMKLATLEKNMGHKAAFVIPV